MNSSKVTTLLLCFGVLTHLRGVALADGKVFAQAEVRAKVEIPNQQALISYHDGVECLVIETAFLGEGTNFAWVVPLPAEAKVQPVSNSFFPGLQRAFQPRLIHEVPHYYVGMLFFLGLAFLGWRSLKDEVSCVADLPLCLLLAIGIGLAGQSAVLGGLAFAFVVITRLVIRTTISYALMMLVGLMFMAWVTAGYGLWKSGLISTMGDSAAAPSDVTVLSVQRAGVFDATTIRSEKPSAILEWLTSNGFAAPPSIEPVVRDYVARGWVFVANKVRRADSSGGISVLHPLSFIFPTKTPVYPLKLTGVENGDCTIDLYVFGDKRASAPHFRPLRCDRVANNLPDKPVKPSLNFGDPEVMNSIGRATVGTKLTARLTSKQMSEDTQISWRGFSAKGATVYSRTGAATIALNTALPLAAIGWLFIGACQGSWDVNREFIRRWRVRMIFMALGAGAVVYWWLPKVEVIAGPGGFG